MRYLHGDSSPFPLNENFIDTLCAATDTSVGLLRADALAADARRVIAETGESVTKELSRLEGLSRSIDRALLAHHGATEAPSSVTEAAAARVALQTRTTIEEARAGVMRWRDTTIATANASVPDVHALLGAFLVRHQLPDTAWTYEWKASARGIPPRAQVHARTPAGVAASFEVGLPQNHLWAGPVRVSVLLKRAVIQMLRKGVFGRVKMRDEALHRYYVTEVTNTSERSSIMLSRSPKQQFPAIEVRYPGNNPKAPLTVTRFDERGARASQPAVLAGQDAAITHQLWDRVNSTMADIIFFRNRLVFSALEGTPVQQFQNPAIVAKAILGAITPIVRDMRRHSRTPGELALKRDLGDGRREEIFISHEELKARFAQLTAAQRAAFDVFGLDERPTLAVVYPLPRPAPPPSNQNTMRLPVYEEISISEMEVVNG